MRAVQELFKTGLILIECKATNHYKIVAKWGSYKSENEKNFNADILSDNSGQIVTSQNDKKCKNGSELILKLSRVYKNF